jgi:hypothetical protein
MCFNVTYSHDPSRITKIVVLGKSYPAFVLARKQSESGKGCGRCARVIVRISALSLKNLCSTSAASIAGNSYTVGKIEHWSESHATSHDLLQDRVYGRGPAGLRRVTSGRALSPWWPADKSMAWAICGRWGLWSDLTLYSIYLILPTLCLNV